MDNDKTSKIVGALVLVVLVVGVLTLVNWPTGSPLKQFQDSLTGKKETAPAPVQKPPEVYVPKDGTITQVVIPIERQANMVIDITTAGFSPAEINITTGTVVLWTNRDKTPHWVASVASNRYPESGPCGSKFDSCAGLKLGENLRVTFNRSGIWDYVDKLNPKFTGRVTVQ